MFRDFSFGPALSRSPGYQNDNIDVSPSSTPPPMAPDALPPLAHRDLSDLVQRFEGYSISKIEPSYFYGYSSMPEDETLGMDDDPVYTPDYSYLRERRQAIDCDSTNFRDLSILIKQMVENGDQCAICSPSSISGTSSYASSENGEDTEPSRPYNLRSLNGPASPTRTIRYKRSAECINPSRCVAKDVRVRKKRSNKSSSSRK